MTHIRTIGQYNPNVDLVKVDHATWSRVYEVKFVKSYISKCESEGKKCKYLGRTDENGNLKYRR